MIFLRIQFIVSHYVHTVVQVDTSNHLAFYTRYYKIGIQDSNARRIDFTSTPLKRVSDMNTGYGIEEAESIRR